MRAGIGRRDLHRAAGVRVHRPDVHLVAVPTRGRGAVVADRNRKEVEHQVRVGDLVVRADEAAALEVVRRARAAAEEPLQPDPRALPLLQRRLHGDRLLAAVLDVDLEVVLEVLADAGEVVHHVHAERLELARVADPRELEELRGVDRAAAEDHLAPADLAQLAALERLDADGAARFEEDPGDELTRLDGQVRPVQHGMEVGACRAPAAAAADVAVERGEALLAVAVDVVGQRVARLLHRLEEGPEERARCRAALEPERALAPAPLVAAREAALHALEVRKAVSVVPGLHPGVGGPALEVERVAPLEDHPVDARGAAEHLAARVVDAAAVHVRLGLRLVHPVVALVADRERKRGGHVDERVEDPIAATGLEHEHARRRVLAQPVRERAARGPSADDDEIVCHRHRATVRNGHVRALTPDMAESVMRAPPSGAR